MSRSVLLLCLSVCPYVSYVCLNRCQINFNISERPDSTEHVACNMEVVRSATRWYSPFANEIKTH